MAEAPQADQIAALRAEIEDLTLRVQSIEDARSAEKEAGAETNPRLQPVRQEPRNAGLHPTRKREK